MNPNPEPKPTEADATKPPVQTPTPSSVAPQSPQTNQLAQPTIAEPPKGIEFTEVPDEPVAPVTPGTVTQPVVVADPPSKKKKPTKAGPKGPGRIIFLAVIVFAVLAGLAYYAYTKSV